MPSPMLDQEALDWCGCSSGIALNKLPARLIPSSRWMTWCSVVSFLFRSGDAFNCSMLIFQRLNFACVWESQFCWNSSVWVLNCNCINNIHSYVFCICEVAGAYIYVFAVLYRHIQLLLLEEQESTVKLFNGASRFNKHPTNLWCALTRSAMYY